MLPFCATAVQTLGADSRARIEETINLRILSQRLGASPKELAATRPSVAINYDANTSDIRCDGFYGKLPQVLIEEVASIKEESVGKRSTSVNTSTSHASSDANQRRVASDVSLDSQVSLQDRLQKVRCAFADVRRQVEADYLT